MCHVAMQVREPERSVGAAARRAEVQQVPSRAVLLAGVSDRAPGRAQGRLQETHSRVTAHYLRIWISIGASKESQLEAKEAART